jgi:hypothetical protein
MTSPQASSARIPNLDGWRGVVVFLLACAVVIARRPDAVFHAQFYAEDGAIWFADAYNYGWWRVLFSPNSGYVQVLPRAAATIALLVPLSCAALVENLIAIAIQAFPVSLLLSSRSAPWGSFRFRALLAALYLFLPNTREMVGTVTESQWILGLIALLLLVALPPRSTAGRAFDLVTFTFCGLTGPFCIFLFPIAAFLLWGRRQDRWRRVTTSVLFLGLVIQGLSPLLLHPSDRHHPFLGASPEWFVRLLAGQVYLGTLLGGNGLSQSLSAETLAYIAVAGTVILVLAAKSAPTGMRLLLLLSTLLFAAALASPVTFPPPGSGAWKMLSTCAGARYWFFMSLAFAWALAYCARSAARAVRVPAVCLLVLMGVGFVRDFRYPRFADLNPQYAKRLAEVPAGTIVTVPVNPSGWNMWLIKR